MEESHHTANLKSCKIGFGGRNSESVLNGVDGSSNFPENINNSKISDHTTLSSLSKTSSSHLSICEQPTSDLIIKNLQNCDIISKTSNNYVFTQRTELSKLDETILSQEISSFYDISNSSTV